MPITQTARRTAQQFAAQQPTSEKAEQVRLNTLAVWVVNDYLQMLGMATDLQQSDLCNPVVRLCANTADLPVVGTGRLECRPLRAQEQICQIPEEVWQDRIGYVFVQMQDSLREATLLGFVPRAVAALPISQLQSLDALLVHLDRLQQARLTSGNQINLSPVSLSPVNLSQWLQNIQNTFEEGWQTIETIFQSSAANLAFRRSRSIEPPFEPDPEQAELWIGRAKLIDFGIQLAEHPLALVVELRPPVDSSIQTLKVEVRLQVHPTGEHPYLPTNLRLIVLDEFGTVFLEAQSRSTDNYIQLQFRGSPGERFSAELVLDEVSITEAFLL
ncbi:DUF1822 family protein [Leptolyngbya sp. FACHB-261]|uniref:DUF1822 family protein n=1 Tax=Leptolyngbya sp. FACHB-261 TaxID=2692806 RepID=UPI0018EF4F56|nr:DUF1822 family protein [Leptolyngbya sp. FACHB-261]